MTAGAGGASGASAAAGASGAAGTSSGGSAGSAGSAGADAGLVDASLDATSSDGAAGAGDGSMLDATPDSPTVDAGCIVDTSQPTLVSQWNAEGDYLDAVGSNHGSPIGNVTFVTGYTGQAFHFDPVAGQRVEVAPSVSLDLTAYSVMAFVKVPSGVDQWSTLISKEDHGRGDPWADRNYGLWVAESTAGCGTGVASFQQTGGGLCAAQPLNDGTWHHLAGTFDGCVLRLYVDGVLAGSAASALPPIGANQRLWFGQWAVTGTEDLDEVRIYKGALDGTTIYSIATS